MTTQQSKSIDKGTKQRAARVATQIKENVVVYKTPEGYSFISQSKFEESKDRHDYHFIATIDKDGNYVD